MGWCAIPPIIIVLLFNPYLNILLDDGAQSHLWVGGRIRYFIVPKHVVDLLEHHSIQHIMLVICAIIIICSRSSK